MPQVVLIPAVQQQLYAHHGRNLKFPCSRPVRNGNFYPLRIFPGRRFQPFGVALVLQELVEDPHCLIQIAKLPQFSVFQLLSQQLHSAAPFPAAQMFQKPSRRQMILRKELVHGAALGSVSGRNLRPYLPCNVGNLCVLLVRQHFVPVLQTLANGANRLPKLRHIFYLHIVKLRFFQSLQTFLHIGASDKVRVVCCLPVLSCQLLTVFNSPDADGACHRVDVLQSLLDFRFDFRRCLCPLLPKALNVTHDLVSCLSFASLFCLPLDHIPVVFPLADQLHGRLPLCLQLQLCLFREFVQQPVKALLHGVQLIINGLPIPLFIPVQHFRQGNVFRLSLLRKLYRLLQHEAQVGFLRVKAPRVHRRKLLPQDVHALVIPAVGQINAVSPCPLPEALPVVAKFVSDLLAYIDSCPGDFPANVFIVALRLVDFHAVFQHLAEQLVPVFLRQRPLPQQLVREIPNDLLHGGSLPGLYGEEIQNVLRQFFSCLSRGLFLQFRLFPCRNFFLVDLLLALPLGVKVTRLFLQCLLQHRQRLSGVRLHTLHHLTLQPCLFCKGKRPQLFFRAFDYSF